MEKNKIKAKPKNPLWRGSDKVPAVIQRRQAWTIKLFIARPHGKINKHWQKNTLEKREAKVCDGTPLAVRGQSQ